MLSTLCTSFAGNMLIVFVSNKMMDEVNLETQKSKAGAEKDYIKIMTM